MLVEPITHLLEGRLEMRHTPIRVTDENRRRLLRYGLAGLLTIVVLFVPAQAALSDTPSPCTTHYGQTGENPGLGVDVFPVLNYDVPEGANSVSGSATVGLYPSWNILFSNNSSSIVTDPTITVSSGLPGFSGSCTQASLDPSGTISLGFVAPGNTQAGSLGYDSSNTVTPNLLPAAGGDVTEQFTVRLTDPRFAHGDITVSAGNGDVNVLSQETPSNLDQGETVSLNGGEWDLSNAQLDKTYVFRALIEVGYAPGPFIFSPPGFVRVGNCQRCDVESTGSSITVPDANIEGSFGFSVDQADQHWTVFHIDEFTTHYADQKSEFTADLCKNGGWQTYGIFKNQCDCVSDVATGGKNPPAGSP
jgi:hypothetical protein